MAKEGIPIDEGQTLEDVPEGEIKTALIAVNITDAIINKLKAEAEALTIDGPDDTAGYERVHRQLLDTVPFRTSAVKIAEKGREKARAEVQQWIDAQKAVVSRIEAIEAGLKAKEQKYLDARKAIQDAIVAKELARIEGMKTRLLAVGWVGNQASLSTMSDAEFNALLSQQTAAFEKAEADRKELERLQATERERLAKEADEARQREAAAEAERQKLVAERAELERQKTELAEQQRKAEEARLKAELDAKNAELAKVREAEQARKHEEAKKAEEVRKLALAPDVDKINAWADGVVTNLQFLPDIKDGAMLKKVEDSAKSIANVIASLRLSVSQ